MSAPARVHNRGGSVEQTTEWVMGLGLLAVVFVLHVFVWRIYKLCRRHLPWLFRFGRHGRIGRLVDRADGLLGKWPPLQRFVHARFDTSEPTGLPLTIAVLAAIYLALLLGDTVEELFEADELLALDRWVQNLFQNVRSGWVVSLFTWFTRFGDSQALVAVAAVATGFLWALGRGFAVLPLWVVVLGANATTWIGKYAVARTRPEFVTEITAATPSFPSGHATGAMALYGFVAFLVARELTEPRQRFEVGFWSSVLILMVGASRIVLSVHFLSDVLAGFLVGGVWILVGFALYEYRRLDRRGDGARRADHASGKRSACS
ncbi:PAP2 family protein [Oceanidesulfovibrio indonesiensis]|uniref:PAP2 family protein n=1 Tax=Oceanidesulfovibrio indonesiensis TaxID=54767 RepID=A0A7M3MF73_9BACT|nr:PAP2 family protein [Oceanidesulfovibrio indonesiensis]